jgi:transcriptional regulator with XRE-family HTH domain
LRSLGLEQKDLARAAKVTDSYVSQLLNRRKTPPGRDRTDIYPKMEDFLGLQRGELGRVAEIERADEIKRRLTRAPEPLFQHFRDLVLRKCVVDKQEEVRSIFELQPFGTLERLVAQKILEVVQKIARQELESEDWMRLAARVGGRTHEEMRVIVLEFLDKDEFQVSKEDCVAFLDPLVKSWEIEMETFRLDITLNPGLVADHRRTFAFVEKEPEEASGAQPGLDEFLKDSQLSQHLTDEEVGILRRQWTGRRRPTKIYYYRVVQNLRDPLNFSEQGN